MYLRKRLNLSFNYKVYAQVWYAQDVIKAKPKNIQNRRAKENQKKFIHAFIVRSFINM